MYRGLDGTTHMGSQGGGSLSTRYYNERVVICQMCLHCLDLPIRLIPDIWKGGRYMYLEDLLTLDSRGLSCIIVQTTV